MCTAMNALYFVEKEKRINVSANMVDKNLEKLNYTFQNKKNRYELQLNDYDFYIV